MRTLTLLILTMCLVCEAVVVQEGQFSFSLESVKKLGDILGVEATARRNTHLGNSEAVCKDPALPQEFLSLCQNKDARASFSRLALVAARADACEICSFPACTGC